MLHTVTQAVLWVSSLVALALSVGLLFDMRGRCPGIFEALEEHADRLTALEGMSGGYEQAVQAGLERLDSRANLLRTEWEAHFERIRAAEGRLDAKKSRSRRGEEEDDPGAEARFARIVAEAGGGAEPAAQLPLEVRMFRMRHGGER